MNDTQLIPHLFRTEFRKIVSVLCKRFGFDQIETAEDIASDTFLTAAQTWGIEGIPSNPVAWLYLVAKNKAKNHLQRSSLFDSKISPDILKQSPGSYEDDIDLSPQNINDSQLQMMFAICHPAIPTEAQIGLSLRILCGFGIDEIATAFLTGKDTINKRLMRAKDTLRKGNIRIALPDQAETESRLDPVLTTIYLLFNEGYYSISQDSAIRKDICLEAMRLCTMLVENPGTNKPQVNALLALMYFHSSRFDARIDQHGEMILYDEQDTSLWNTELISRGGYFLQRAASGDRVSRYHIEAGIAYWHTQKNDVREKWESILQLYDRLLQVEYSPLAALNRAFALSKTNGKQEAIAEVEKLKLTGNFFYFALLGELYTNLDNDRARTNLLSAIELARTSKDKTSLQKKVDRLP